MRISEKAWVVSSLDQHCDLPLVMSTTADRKLGGLSSRDYRDSAWGIPECAYEQGWFHLDDGEGKSCFGVAYEQGFADHCLITHGYRKGCLSIADKAELNAAGYYPIMSTYYFGGR